MEELKSAEILGSPCASAQTVRAMKAGWKLKGVVEAVALAESKRRSWVREGKEPREDCQGSPGLAGRGRRVVRCRERGNAGARLPGEVGNRTGLQEARLGFRAGLREENGSRRECSAASPVHAPLSTPRVPIPGAGSARGAAARKRQTSRTYPPASRRSLVAPTRVPGAPRGGGPGQVRRSPGSRAGAARRQGARRGPGTPPLGGAIAAPRGRPRAAGLLLPPP